MVAGADVNAIVSGLLGDLASIQASRERQWAYKRAAAAIARLEEPLPTLQLPGGGLPKIPHIGPSSSRVIGEILAAGRSQIVEQAIAASGKTTDVERRRSLRTGFFSRAEARRILRQPSNGLVTLDDYRGDLQTHSRWSDGATEIAELASGAMARGYHYVGITDHSNGLPIARGMSRETMTAQHLDIDAVNRDLGGRFRVIKGVEANILPDGRLDVTGDDLAGVELVLAAPHSKLRMTDDQTTRLLHAVSTPGVHILAHPRGRQSGTRAGIQADWDRIFTEAARRHVAVEIDGDPSRQDLDHVLAARALDAGCLLALDSDAHDVDELVYAETALAHARLAGAPASRIINCWPLADLLEWLKKDR
jgi:histidinol phosphatase-like PHP family hydrolase